MSTEEQLDTRLGESLSLVLPAFNEAENIGPMLGLVLGELERLERPWEVIVVDDGSWDDTAARVQELALDYPNIVLIQHGRNLGYGAALRSGFAKARNELVFFTDADLQFQLFELAVLLEQIGGCALVAGYRSPRVDPLHRRLLGRLWSAAMNQFFGVGIRDVNCAYKLIRREALNTLSLRSSGAFINAEIVIGLRDAGFQVEECPVGHQPRPSGCQSGASWRVIVKALGEAMTYQRT
jgi:glycosyltransferase involved in cell wall biosynthesis